MQDLDAVKTIAGFTVYVPPLLPYENQREKEIAVNLREQQIKSELDRIRRRHVEILS